MLLNVYTKHFIFSLTLSDRTFSTYSFYKQCQDDLTPSGLAFFQTDWDKSLKEFYHSVLGMYNFGVFVKKLF